jgi:hypothetical protein
MLSGFDSLAMQWDTKNSQATAASNICDRKPKTRHLHSATALSRQVQETFFERIWSFAFLWAYLYSHLLIHIDKFHRLAMRLI